VNIYEPRKKRLSKKNAYKKIGKRIFQFSLKMQTAAKILSEIKIECLGVTLIATIGKNKTSFGLGLISSHEAGKETVENCITVGDFNVDDLDFENPEKFIKERLDKGLERAQIFFAGEYEKAEDMIFLLRGISREIEK